MKRVLMMGVGACAALVIGASSVPAQDASVAGAIKAIEAVGADPGKLKLFCELNNLVESAGEKEDPALDAKIDDALGKLGEDFSSAWEVGEGLDESTEDGKKFYGAVDALAEKCN